MVLAGVPIHDRHWLELATKLRDAGHADTAARITAGYDRQTRLLALSVTEREEILDVLVDCAEGLAELRGVLLQECEWRRREGL